MFILILRFTLNFFVKYLIAEVCKHLSVYLRKLFCTSINREKCDFCFISFSRLLCVTLFSRRLVFERWGWRGWARSFWLFIFVLKANFCHDREFSVGLQTSLQFKKLQKKWNVNFSPTHTQRLAFFKKKQQHYSSVNFLSNVFPSCILRTLDDFRFRLINFISRDRAASSSSSEPRF